MTSTVSQLKENAGIILLAVLLFAVGCLRLNDISLYTPDSTLYVIWGNSIAHGEGFVDNTKPDPDRYIINAPLYSLLIAPAEIFFPYSLVAVKFWTLLWGIGALFLFYVWLKRLLGKSYALAGSILLAFNPMSIVFFTEALSEAPFLFMLLSIALIMEKIFERKSESLLPEHPSRANFVVLFSFLAVVTLLREIGAAVVFAAVLFFFLKRKPKYAILALVLAGAFFAAWYIRNNIMIGVPPGGRGGNLRSIIEHFVTDPSAPLVQEIFYRVVGNAKTYFLQLGGTLFYSLFSNKQINLIVSPSRVHLLLFDVFSNTKYLITFMGTSIMLAGVFNDFKSHATASFRALIVLGLLAVIMIYPIYDIRFLTPLLVFMIYYLMSGTAYFLRNIIKRVHLEPALVWLALFLMLPNASAIAEIIQTNIAFRRDPIGLTKKAESLPVIYLWPWHIMGEWIQEHTEESAIIASPIKELARAVGDRKVLELEPNIVEPAFEASLREFNASYILTAVRWGNFSTYEFAMRESDRYRFTPLYSAGGLTLYKITSRLRYNLPPGQPYIFPTDTVSTTGLLRMGRDSYRQNDLPKAARFLRRAHELTPEMEEPLYQLVITYAMMNDSANAGLYFRRLLALPQTLSHTILASDLLHALDIENGAGKSGNVQHNALQMLDASLKYWNNGYYDRARSLMDTVLLHDSQFFAGLLWGFHYNLQTGDTALATSYCNRVWKIDSTNVIAKAFRKVLMIGDSLRMEANPRERSRMHLEIGELYRAVDLPIVDLDEAERSLREDSTNVQAVLFMAKTLEDVGRLNTAKILYSEALRMAPANLEIGSKVKALQSRMTTGKPR